MKVPQFLPWVGSDEYEGLRSCFEINWITEGPKAKEFVERILDLTGSRYGVLAPNGTLAIYLGLRAMGVGIGDEVIVPDFTFIGSATAVEMTGAKPVFVDVNRENFQIDVTRAEALVGPATKAVMPVHIYGTAVNMTEVLSFADRHNLLILEDAAQGIGVHYNKKHVGSFGNTGIFSFFADKTITTGEGGMVITDDEALYNKLLFLRNMGRKERGSFIHPEIGYNLRMTDMQCALGLVQLSKLPRILERKTEIRDLYQELLGGIPELTLFQQEPGADFYPFRVGVLCSRAEELMEFMRSREIETRTFFHPLHSQPCFAYLREDSSYQYSMDDAAFENAVYGYNHGICLPSFPTIQSEQVHYVCETIGQFYGK